MGASLFPVIQPVLRSPQKLFCLALALSLALGTTASMAPDALAADKAKSNAATGKKSAQKGGKASGGKSGGGSKSLDNGPKVKPKKEVKPREPIKPRM